ncbi:MAG TPA: YHS domain-containing protein [Propionicimonas sp.]
MGTSETTIDPVCGMTVDPQTAAFSAEYEGRTYYFCAKGCQRAFTASPAEFVSAAPAEQRPR